MTSHLCDYSYFQNNFVKLFIQDFDNIIHTDLVNNINYTKFKTNYIKETIKNKEYLQQIFTDLDTIPYKSKIEANGNRTIITILSNEQKQKLNELQLEIKKIYSLQNTLWKNFTHYIKYLNDKKQTLIEPFNYESNNVNIRKSLDNISIRSNKSTKSKQSNRSRFSFKNKFKN